MTRRRPVLILVTLLTGALSVGLDQAAEGGTPAHNKNEAVNGHTIVVLGNGMGKATFGQPEAAAATELRAVLGRPRTRQPVRLTGNCTIDAALEWPAMTAYFFHGDFVGYATGSLLGGPGNRQLPNVATAAGLRIGDTLARARHLYGRSLRTSYAQGGSWFAGTPAGTLAGYLTSEVRSTKPVPRIADITAGSVGCPAASP